MSVARGIAVVVVCSVAFGLAGGLLGVTLALGAPGYYRSVFRAGDDPAFNPVQVGVGLGVSQGLLSGAVIGAVVVLAVSLSRRSRQNEEPVLTSNAQALPQRAGPTPARVVLRLAVLFAAAACGGGVGFVVGAITGQLQLYQRDTDVKLQKIRPVLRERRFAGVIAESSSAAQVYLTGTVGSEQDRKALEGRMRFLFGDEEARFMTANVGITNE